LETRALEGEGDLFIDKDLLSKALFFILENSIEASAQMPMGKKGRVVKVSLFEDGEDIGISISDKGEGIPRKNINQIFVPFFSTRPDRVGLGLTMAKRVVEEQGGRIQVESRLKRGTTITLIFQKDRRRMVRRKKISPEDAGKVID
jgi:signal transduction histidine kinase